MNNFQGEMLLILCALLISGCALANSDSSYDYSANIHCLEEPLATQYGGGLVVNSNFDSGLDGWDVFGNSKIMLRKSIKGNYYMVAYNRSLPTDGFSHQFYLQKDYLYTFPAWFQMKEGKEIISALIRDGNGENRIVGSVIAKSGCWSMLKGGFTADADIKAHLFFKCSKTTVELWIDNVSLKQFSKAQWRDQQQKSIDQIRKREIKIHITNNKGERVEGAKIKLTQTRPHFPIGCGSTAALLDNKAYQDYFAARFTAATPDNEMKWYFTEAVRGRENYTVPDAMVSFFKENRISVRGHNILWDNADLTPHWVRPLPPREVLHAAVARIASVVSRYRGDVVAWDVVNENLHNSYFESVLGPNSSAMFYQIVGAMDPWTPLFMNEYNTLEYPEDMEAIPWSYVKKIREMKSFGGNEHLGIHIGLQAHFSRPPNVSHMRAALDVLGATNMPIWLTELDTKRGPRQGIELEEVMREAFSHPAVEGMIVWGGWKPTNCNETCLTDDEEVAEGCAQMCLIDKELKNVEAGEVVDKLIQEWRNVDVVGVSDEEGVLSEKVFMGEYSLTISQYPSLPNPLHNTSLNVTKGNKAFDVFVAL